jgi:hypothetical protein
MEKILDSGVRREFPTGAVRDVSSGTKGRCDLLPLGIAAMVMNESVLALIESFRQTGDTCYIIEAIRDFKVFRDLPDMMLEVALHFEAGAIKYGEHNWQKGIPIHSYVDSGVRHYLKFNRGDDDERHDRAFIFNMLCLVWTMINKPELDDFTNKREACRDSH